MKPRSSDEFVQVMCCTCSIKFKLTEDFYTLRKKDHREFFCPVGHVLVYRVTETSEDAKEVQKENKKLKITVSHLEDQLDTARDIIEGKNG